MTTTMTSAITAAVFAVVLSVPCRAVGQDAQSGIAAATIGLFLPTSGPDAADADELRAGAQVAADNYTGGSAHCTVVAAANGGQWNAGAGELVRLVYSEGVSAVLGPIDGRTAHVAEQVVARGKGRFVLVTPWASEPTLTQIKIPWFFRLVPDDRRQAEAVVAELSGARGLRKLAVVVAESHYDTGVAFAAFEKALMASNTRAERILVEEQALGLERTIGAVRAADAEAVGIFAPPGTAARLARALRSGGIRAPLFGPLRLASSTFLNAADEAAEGMLLAAPPEASGPAAEQFRAKYRMACHREPSAAAAYGYDGAMVLLAALAASGNASGEALRAAVAATRRDGLTGTIQFDAAGNRAGAAPLARVERGHLRPLHRTGDSPRTSTIQPISVP